MFKSSKCTNPSASVNPMDQNISLQLEYLNPEIPAKYPDTFLTSYVMCVQCHLAIQLVSVLHCYSNPYLM